MSQRLEKALAAIDAAHSNDPTKTIINGEAVPYELLYAQKMTKYLHQLSSTPSEELQLAIRAQHFRRWEVPRSSYPMTKIGYHSWRTYLKKRQAELVAPICRDAEYSKESVERIEALIKKEGLNKGEEEVQILEDVACLVFLDDQFDEFEKEHDEDKIVGILRKTWGKMGSLGRSAALEMQMSGRAKELVGKALEGN
ncbi:hypothetical protein EJ05DRAFT_267153 [Pseudovirgaria hyperparasitica]|uniref:Glutamyl-tRNA synthetase n=1 Tax=Pseudovirgaria hyperparasitica TaxID=470096 RepID=A0A6A6VU10_9PEZI|nr:uncharacterized protein EJ05DRAFT_267153 [Pseudovirgaria hyperparasitica]KAF2752731.1 hypothetical protein EJ05DRAFT_267153 [Pseudovirgaria hyperparasitica]